MGDDNGSAKTSEKKTKSLILIYTTILLGLIAVATAWSGYQGSNWGSENSANTTLANRARAESIRASLSANQLNLLDIQLFIEWLNATAQGQTQLADFYRERMREEAQPAVNAWLAQDPFNNPDAPTSPFVMPEYVLQQRVEAGQLENEAAELAAEASEASDISRQYILTTVILASAFFFVGLSTRLASIRYEITFAAMATLLFAYGIFRLALLWINVGG